MKKVMVGTKVSLKNISSNEVIEVAIQYQKIESRPKSGTGAYGDLDYKDDVVMEKFDKGIISDETEMGRKLIGKKIGDTIIVSKNKYLIENIV